jgi:SAM-dependent methyltransferase
VAGRADDRQDEPGLPAPRGAAADPRRVRQFLDLGSGIPTVGTVHELAQADDPEAQVVYVDVDPVAVEHARAILAGNPRTGVIRADLRHPDLVLAHRHLHRLLDLDQPVAVLMVAVLHFIPDADDPARAGAAYRDALTAGSYLVVARATADGQQPDRAAVDTGRPAPPRPYVVVDQMVLRWCSDVRERNHVFRAVLVRRPFRCRTSESPAPHHRPDLLIRGPGQSDGRPMNRYVTRAGYSL